MVSIAEKKFKNRWHQGYIIFPAIIGIIQRLANSVTVTEDGTVTIDFQLKGIETAQIFSISVSMVIMLKNFFTAVIYKCS